MGVYDDVYALRFDHTSLLHNRVIVAVAVVALDVLEEDAGTTNHADRVIWANDALVNTTNAADRMMWSVLADNTVRTAELTTPGSATDSQIKSAVAAAVDTYAG